MPVRVLQEALNYGRKSPRQSILWLPEVPNAKVASFETRLHVWKGTKSDGIVVVGGAPARPYVLTRKQSNLLIENALIIMRELWEVFNPVTMTPGMGSRSASSEEDS